MIRLKKGPEPEVLKNNKEDWTRDLLSAVADKDDDRVTAITRRYNHPEIKTKLKLETKEKCAYCEAKVTDVAHGDIEHVTPKSIDRSRTFLWENLTFACQICNQRKSNKEDIVDPYNDPVEDHIFFAGAFIKGRSEKGTRTVAELKLNRAALVESRNREIERYASELEKIFLLQNRRTKELLFLAMIEQLDTGTPEFVAACRLVVEAFRKDAIE